MVGDVLASTILCEHLKSHYPESEVHFLINENTRAVVDGNPYVDKIILFENRYRNSQLAFYRFLKSIKKQKYDVTIDVYCKLESNLISYFSRADLRISYKKWYSKFVYTHLFSYSKNNNTTLGYAIENRLLLLTPIIKELQKPNLAPKIYLLEKEVHLAKKTLANHGIKKSKPVIMVGILGSGQSKSYPLKYLAETLDFIVQNFDVIFLLNYLPNQKEAVEELLSFCSEKSKRAINKKIFGRSLRAFIGLLSQCDGYIGNEGGASNISKALDIPNFSIFSPWISKQAWLTFNDNNANQAVHLSDYNSDILKIPAKYRKKNSLELYKTFRPRFFKAQLRNFIEDYVISD